MLSHPLYVLNGKDVQIELPLAPWEAALGAKVAVPTLGGTVELTIPPGAQSGQKLRLRGRGMPASPNGDQLVIIKLVTPAADTAAAREAYERMKRELPFDPRAGWPVRGLEVGGDGPMERAAAPPGQNARHSNQTTETQPKSKSSSPRPSRSCGWSFTRSTRIRKFFCAS